MKRFTQRLLIGIVAFSTVSHAWSLNWDFKVDGLYYAKNNVTDSEADAEVRVVNPDARQGGYQFPTTDGVLEIPSSVSYAGVTYGVTRVVGITYQNALKRLALPKTVREVHHIYECQSLEEVDFGGATWIGAVNNLPSLRKMMIRTDTPVEVQLGALSELGIERCELASDLALEEMSFSYWDELSYLDLSKATFTGGNVFNVFPNLVTLLLPEVFNHSVVRDSFNWLPSLETLTLPKDVPENFTLIDCLKDCGKLKEIYCLSDVPISIKEDYDTYTNIGTTKIDSESCRVYVPLGSLNAYKEHPSWSMFKSIAECDFSSIEEINGNNAPLVIKVTADAIQIDGDENFSVYDLSGRVCNATGLTPGIYIVKTSTGQSVKVKL